MEPRIGAGDKRISRWIRWSLVIIFATLASAAYFFYMSNGVVAGDLIGLPGREGDVAAAQQNAMYWYSAFWAFQLGVVISLFLKLRFGADAAPFTRFVMRGLSAVFLSFVATTFIGTTIFLVLRLFWYHVSRK